jgi:hypothetical protein
VKVANHQMKAPLSTPAGVERGWGRVGAEVEIRAQIQRPEQINESPFSGIVGTRHVRLTHDAHSTAAGYP